MSGTSHRISCADVEALLPAIADDQLDADQAPDVFAHVAGCGACQESLALYDLCSLTISRGRQPARDPAPVIHYHMPRWVSGVAAVAASLLAAVLLLEFGANPETSDSQHTQLADGAPVEILQVIPDESGRGQLFLIRNGEQTLLVDPEQLDESVTGPDGRPVQMPVQVLNSR